MSIYSGQKPNSTRYSNKDCSCRYFCIRTCLCG